MIALIVAYDSNRVIGNNGKIPWNIKGEQKRFKDLTTDNIVIMGRKSFEEIGKPLPNRYTIVVSSTVNYEYDNCTTVKSLDEALKITEEKDKNIFICGGRRLYEESINIVDKMYITLIKGDFKGDTYFPKFDESKFKLEINSLNDSSSIPFIYLTYTRKK